MFHTLRDECLGEFFAGEIGDDAAAAEEFQP
jgi:hypothetical protein